MTPLRRLQIREDALGVLGLDLKATPKDIRAAWKKRAFVAHPDRPNGSLEEFERIRLAYDFLCGEGAATERMQRPNPINPKVRRRSKPAPTAQVRRPRVTTRIIDVSAEIADECRKVLQRGAHIEKELAKKSVISKLCDGGPASAEEPAENFRHIPRAIRRRGRQLSYIIQTPLREGANRIALPTSAVQSAETSDARVLQIKSSKSGKGTVQMPESVLQKMFPGANQVRIHFMEEPDIA